MPRILAVLESALYVQDLERALGFYRDVLGLRLMQTFPQGRGLAFEAGPSVLLLFRSDRTRKAGLFPAHGTKGSGHVAFRISAEEIEAWRKKLAENGVAIEKELSFDGKPPSIYFRDPDGNSLELAINEIWPFQSISAG